MKKWALIAVTTALMVTTQCVARVSYVEKENKARESAIERRKRQEKEYADRIVRNAKLQTARKKSKRMRDEQTIIDRQEQQEREKAYREEVRQFAQLTQELALPLYTERPILDLVHEAEFRLQTIASYNPRALQHYQMQLERALQRGRHPIEANSKERYTNTELIARQSIDSLLDYTRNAEQLVEQTAQYAQTVADDMKHTMYEHRNSLAALTEHLNTQLFASENRIQNIDTQIAQLNDTIKKNEFEVIQKEGEAANLAQCIDTFHTVSSKLNQNRIDATEKIIQDLEEKAHRAEQHTAILMLRLHAAEKSIRAFEKTIAQRTMQK